MDVNKWKERLQSLWSGEKLPKKNHLLILFLIGMLLFVAVFPFPTSNRSEEAERGEEASIISQDSGIMGEYEAYLEERTADILKQVDGVGEVTVMITLKSGSQKIIEKDQSSTAQTTEEADSTGGTRSVEDTSSTPYVSKEMTPEIEGVVVIADGGDNAVVVESITEAVQALFGVEAHKIKIMKRA